MLGYLKVPVLRLRAHVKLISTINGWSISEAYIDKYDVELTEKYAFNISDEQLLSMIQNKGLLLGDQSIDLIDATGIRNRRDTFHKDNLSMTIVATIDITKPYYDAVADVYYTYKISEDGQYWELDSFHGTNFNVERWGDFNGVYKGYVGTDIATLEIYDFTDGRFNAVLVSDSGQEKDLTGVIDPNTLEVNLSDPDSENVLLNGLFSADKSAFTGKYGKRSGWAFVKAAGVQISKPRSSESGAVVVDQSRDENLNDEVIVKSTGNPEITLD